MAAKIPRKKAAAKVQRKKSVKVLIPVKTKAIKEKRTGDPDIARWVRNKNGGFMYCPKGCGCKLRTDGLVIWCSYVECNYFETALDKAYI